MEMTKGCERCSNSSSSHLLDMLVVRVHLRGERDPPCLVTPLTINRLVNPCAVKVITTSLHSHLVLGRVIVESLTKSFN